MSLDYFGLKGLLLFDFWGRKFLRDFTRSPLTINQIQSNLKKLSHTYIKCSLKENQEFENNICYNLKIKMFPEYLQTFKCFFFHSNKIINILDKSTFSKSFKSYKQNYCSQTWVFFQFFWIFQFSMCVSISLLSFY